MTQPEWSDRPDPAQMRQNYDAVLGLARRGGFRRPENGWTAELVLAHVLTVTETFDAVGDGIGRGETPEAVNPDAVEDEYLARRVAELGGVEGVAARLEVASAELVERAAALSDADAGTVVRFVAIHDGRVLIDEQRSYGSILTGHASFHLPMHIKQLEALAGAQ